MKTSILLIFACVVQLVPFGRATTHGYTGRDYVELVGKAAAGCRARADALAKKIAECQQFLAANPRGSCTVTYETRKFSVATAEAMAADFSSAASQFENQLPEVRKRQIKVQADEAAIRALGFERTAKEFEEWEKLSKDAQAEFEMKLAEVAIGNVLVGAKEAVGAVKSLNPWNAQKIIGKFKAAGIEDPTFFENIRRLAKKSAQGKAAWIKDWHKVIDELKIKKDSFFLGAAYQKEGHVDKKLVLEAVATMLSWLLTNPVLELIVLDVQVAAAYAYAVRAVTEVDNLMRLTEEQLRSMSKLKTRTEEDWKALNLLMSSLPQPCSLSTRNPAVGL